VVKQAKSNRPPFDRNRAALAGMTLDYDGFHGNQTFDVPLHDNGP